MQGDDLAAGGYVEVVGILLCCVISSLHVRLIFSVPSKITLLFMSESKWQKALCSFEKA